MKKVLITGATGFVGANLARRLVYEGYEVNLILRPNYKTWRIVDLLSDVNLYDGSLMDNDFLNGTLRQIRPDWIFHLAVYGGYSHQTDKQEMINTNILGTINLLEACLSTGFEAFINTGSSSEYGMKPHPFSESDWLDPNSYYGVTKSSATLYCRYSAQKHKMPIYTLRLFSVYGPYEEPTRLIPTLIKEGLNNCLPQLVSPKIARDFVYIDDVTDAFLLAANTANQEIGAIYNVGTGIQTTIKEVVDKIKKILNIQAEPEWNTMPNRIWDMDIWVANNAKIKDTFNWKPKFLIDEGLESTVRWMIQNNKNIVCSELIKC